MKKSPESKRAVMMADLQAACKELPLFPLPQVVLFPHAKLPLHIFEPRYRMMLRHSLATHRMLGIVLLLDDEEGDDDTSEQPKIASVAGVGLIAESEEMPDGRFNIVVQGMARVAVEELPLVPPFRRAQARVLQDESDVPEENDVSALMVLATRFASVVRAQNANFDFSLAPDLTAAESADMIAHHLILDAKIRQQILEERSPRERVRKTLDAIAMQVSAAGRHSNRPRPVN
jgi:uncharacterized protein